MGYTRQCPFCNAYLDPNEKCECREEKKQKLEKLESLFYIESNGQMSIKEEKASEN